MRVLSANVPPCNRMNSDQALGSCHLSPKESCWLEHTAPDKGLWKVDKSTNTKNVQQTSARKEGGKVGRQNNRGNEEGGSSVRTCWGRAENKAACLWNVGKPQERIKWFYLRQGAGLQPMRQRDKEPEWDKRPQLWLWTKNRINRILTWVPQQRAVVHTQILQPHLCRGTISHHLTQLPTRKIIVATGIILK